MLSVVSRWGGWVTFQSVSKPWSDPAAVLASEKKKRVVTSMKRCRKCQPGVLGNTLLLAHVCNLGLKRSLSPLSVAVILHFVCCLICPFWMHLHISHTSHTHTQAETHLPVGAVVDNSRLSAPEASAGTAVFMLKQQQRRFTVPPPSSFPQPPQSDVPTQDGLHSSLTSSTSSLPGLWKSPLRPQIST